MILWLLEKSKNLLVRRKQYKVNLGGGITRASCEIACTKPIIAAETTQHEHKREDVHAMPHAGLVRILEENGRIFHRI